MHSAIYWICVQKQSYFLQLWWFGYNQLLILRCFLILIFNLKERLSSKTCVFKLFLVIQMPKQSTHATNHNSSSLGIYLHCTSFSLSIYFCFGDTIQLPFMLKRTFINDYHISFPSIPALLF